MEIWKETLVVFGNAFLRFHRDFDGGGDFAGGARGPENGVFHRAVGRDGDFLFGLLPLRVVDRDGGLDLAGEVAGDFEGNRDVLPQKTVGRHGDIFQNQVRQGSLTAHRHGENGDVLFAIAGGGGERGFAHVPIAVGQKQHGLEILETLQSQFQGGVEVSAIDGVGVGGRRGKVLHHHFGLVLQRQPELGGAPGVQPLGAADGPVGQRQVARFHAVGRVHEDGDFRGDVAFEAFHIFRTEQREDQQRDQQKAQAFQSSHRAPAGVALPSGKTQPTRVKPDGQRGHEHRKRGGELQVVHGTRCWPVTDENWLNI